MDYKRNEQGRVESDRAQKRKSIAACLKLNKTEHTSIKKKQHTLPYCSLLVSEPMPYLSASVEILALFV